MAVLPIKAGQKQQLSQQNNSSGKNIPSLISLAMFDSKLNCPNWKSNLKWTLKRLSRDPNLHMALLTAAALRKKTALSLQDRKNPLLKLLPFVSKVKRKAESSIFFLPFVTSNTRYKGATLRYFFSTNVQQRWPIGCPFCACNLKKKYECTVKHGLGLIRNKLVL